MSTISGMGKELLYNIFAECDRSSPTYHFTDSFNLAELEVDDISTTFTAESTRKYISVR